MKQSISSIWRTRSPDAVLRFFRKIDAAVAARTHEEPLPVFFRADDIGVPGDRFSRLMEIFARFQAPISLAVVPVWLTTVRWKTLQKSCRCNAGRICWYQHGWRHTNHELRGKKQEFGPERSKEAVAQDLERGRRRLERIMLNRFYPAFTPPWNRCSQTTLEELIALDYRAVSRNQGARPSAPDILPEFYVNVDLHTRREKVPAEGWRNLTKEMEQALVAGYFGIMIHHQRMNDHAFGFLESFLKWLTQSSVFHLVNLSNLVGDDDP